MNEIDKILEDIESSFPIIDFIETTPVDVFELRGKLQFILY